MLLSVNAEDERLHVDTSGKGMVATLIQQARLPSSVALSEEVRGAWRAWPISNLRSHTKNMHASKYQGARLKPQNTQASITLGYVVMGWGG